MTTTTIKPKRGKRLTVVGPGGTIGSHLVSHLARIPGVDRITLIDSGVYEAKDVWGQDITPRDVGKWKAVVQERRLRAINPNLQVDAITEPHRAGAAWISARRCDPGRARLAAWAASAA